MHWRKRGPENDVGQIKPPVSLKRHKAAGIQPVNRGDVWESLNALFTKMGVEAGCDVGGEKDTSRLVIRRRIGRDSANGQVFETVFRDTFAPSFALKVMPHTKFATEAENGNEIDYAKRASNLVVEYIRSRGADGSLYFPMVFSTGSCPKITLDLPPANSELGIGLYHRATIYNSARDLVHRYVSTKGWARYLDPKNLKSEYMEDRVIQPFALYQRLKRDWTKGGDIDESILADDLTIPLEVPIKGEYMAMELAWGDLEVFLRGGPEKYRTYEMLDMFFGRLLQAIYDLQNLLGLVHNDLHWGNVLVQVVNDGVALPLIHDLDYATEFTEDEQFDDMERLFNILLYGNTDTGIPVKRFIPLKVSAKIERLLSLHEDDNFADMHEVVQWWEKTPISSFGFSFGGQTGGEYENMEVIPSRIDEEPFDLL
jgi:hypothetical protein